ncbi:hypothetical protein PsorP6_015068 [Peronosclerospora sorghi]|uniref:Uncharacterized protein n=1 Tax=Peronosclerospora sorghi TaxID=230839 RepID=A0ACC0VSM0_9STRA|nr:hypothetical protein PsorP6_015068 [Peronosclerospora sorghi]
MTNYTMATAGNKRSCPFAAPAKPQRVRSSDDDLQTLQQDVEDLEATLAAVRRRKQSHNTARLDRLHNFFKDSQQHARQLFSSLTIRTQLEYEPSIDAAVFQKMEQNVGKQYDDVAQVFHEAGLTDTTTDFYDARVVTGGQQGTFVRFTTAKVLLFSLDVIKDAMWNGIKKNSMLSYGENFQPRDKDVMYIKREYMLQDDASSASGISVLLRCVCRRYVEPNRLVVVWEGTGDWPQDYLQRNPKSAPIRERGYCVFQPLERRNRHVTPLTLFQGCVCMTPGLSTDIDMNKPECLQMLSNVVIPEIGDIVALAVPCDQTQHRLDITGDLVNRRKDVGALFPLETTFLGDPQREVYHIFHMPPAPHITGVEHQGMRNTTNTEAFASTNCTVVSLLGRSCTGFVSHRSASPHMPSVVNDDDSRYHVIFSKCNPSTQRDLCSVAASL